LATAADEIFADATSIVGSIGVITASFGFTELIEKIGVERRVYTVGENKSILDPFQPAQERDIAILKSIQSDIHEAFVASVNARRGDKLGSDPDLFTGRFWTAASGEKLGLVDGLGNAHTVLRARYGDKVRIKTVPLSKPGILRGRLGLNAPSAEALIGAVRANQLHERYGL
ncbi:MAG: S49 family peptidase, partial [Pseudomonadota bacterium]